MASLPPVEDLVHVDERKWPDRLHWQFSGQRLGEAVEVVDEDEFAAHQAEYGYPPELVEGALASSQRAVTMLRNREEPFGLASRYWIERAGHG